jgi:hypothetical protein
MYTYQEKKSNFVKVTQLHGDRNCQKRETVINGGLVTYYYRSSYSYGKDVPIFVREMKLSHTVDDEITIDVTWVFFTSGDKICILEELSL